MATINGTAGNDSLTGTTSADTINGLGGNDSLLGADGNDSVLGGAGNDMVRGNNGTDWVEGGAGNDNVGGGSGQDSFVFREAGTANADVFNDFATGWDNIQLDAAFFTALGSAGQFSAGDARFWSSTTGTAHDADDRIIYNSTTRQLWYDADGNGSGAAQLIGTLNSGATVVATDIRVFGTGGGGGGSGQTINGTNGNDSLVGGSGNDTINGFAGFDTIDGGAGADSMIGGDQDDIFIVDNTGDVIVETEGGGSFDEARASVSYTLPAWVNNLSLTGTAAINGTGNELDNAITGNGAANQLLGLDGNDTLIGNAGNDTLNGGAGNNTLDGGTGNDTYIVEPSSGWTIADAGGVDTLIIVTESFGGTHVLQEGIENLTLRGETFLGEAYGNDLDNVITNEGDSWVVMGGGDGNDLLLGADGEGDVFTFGFGSGDWGADVVEGGDGLAGDWFNFDYNRTDLSAVTVDFRTGTVSGGGIGGSGTIQFFSVEGARATSFDDLLIANDSGIGLQGANGDDTLIGGAGADGLSGDGYWDGSTTPGGRDSIVGGAGNDTLIGGFGDDTLVGGAGNDQLRGFDDQGSFDGNDQYVFDVAPGAANADTIDYAFESGSDKIVLDGTAHVNLGTSGNFAAGDERFWSSGTGLAHDASDRVIYNTSNGQIWYDADGNGAGAAQLIATLADFAFENLVATDIVAINGSGGGGGGGSTINGTPGNDSLIGTAGNDTINGFAGNDTIDGAGGNDSLLGGDGSDSILGGAGDDTLNGGGTFPSSDTLNGGLGNDTYDLAGGGGNVLIDTGGIDTVIVYNGGNLQDGFENLVVRDVFQETDATGNSLDNVIRIESGSGVAYTTGGAGNDTLIGSSGPTMVAQFSGSNFGNDSVEGNNDVLEFGDAAVVVQMASGTATSSAGSVTFTGIDRVIGSTAGDRITASDAGDRIDGRAGDDTLIGGAGADFILGEGKSFGIPVDTTGTGNDSISGGAGNDTLFGNDGNDTIDGGLGNDRLGTGFTADGSVGGEGNDTFMFTVAPGAANADVITDFNSAIDRIVLDGSAHANTGTSGNFTAGDARFWSSATGTAHDADDRVIYNTGTGELWYDADGSGAGARQLIATLEGTPSVAATDISIINGSGGGGGGGGTTINGTANADTLTGTAGNDTINGLGGNDLINASAGTDVTDGGAGFDTIQYRTATSGVVADFAAGTITGGFAGASTSIANVERIIASNFADQLTGTAGGQNLTGQGGNDTLAGAGGVDTLWGGGGNDFFVFREMGTANADRISDWAAGDKVQLDDSAFTAIGALGNFAVGDARYWAAAGATSGHDANDRVVYNTSTGSLYYDADGSGSGAAQLIATFTGNPAVAATDIAVI